MICPTCKGTGEIPEEKMVAEIEEKQIGALNKNWGLNGFKIAISGHPVFDDGNRYVIYLEPEKGGEALRVSFYKETLKTWIDFF